MLIEFRVANYRSFRDKQVLSMVASADTSLPENVVAVEGSGRLRLLRSAVVYGANASGKSNLVRAIDFALHYIVTSANRPPDAETDVQSFLFDTTSQDMPTRFGFSFLMGGVRYEYGYALDREIVREEWLTAYPHGLPQKWFVRRQSSSNEQLNITFGSHLKGARKSIRDATRPEMLFLSRAADLGQEYLTPVFEWFLNDIRVISDSSEDDRMARRTSFRLEKDEEFAQYVARMLRHADLGIDRISVEEKPWKELLREQPERVRVTFIEYMRAVYDNFNEEMPIPNVRLLHRANDAVIPLPIEEESRGTQRFFALAYPWMYALKRGAILAVDELDASLHPALTRELVALFHSDIHNPKNGQLIFNTHDTTLLDPTLFRRDQVWFVEKDRGGASHLYPLLDFRPRKDEALQRGYLQGRYGAVPFVEAPSQPLFSPEVGSQRIAEE